MPKTTNWDDNADAVRIVLNSHRPAEGAWDTAHPDPNADPSFICSKCGNDWPCNSYTKAKTYNDKNKNNSNAQVLGATPPPVPGAGGVVAGRATF